MVGVACPPSMGRKDGRHGLAVSKTAVALGAKDRERPRRLARIHTAQAVTRCFGPRFPPQFLLFKQLDRTYPAERRGLRLLRRAECTFPSHHRPGGRGTKPPASLRGTMESGPTGQTRSSNPPARLRGGCARVRRPRFGARLHGKAQSGQRASLRARPGPGRDTIGLPVVG